MPAPGPLGAILEPLEHLGLPYCINVRDVRFVRAATMLDVAFVEQEVARLGLQQEWLRCTPET